MQKSAGLGFSLKDSFPLGNWDFLGSVAATQSHQSILKYSCLMIEQIFAFCALGANIKPNFGLLNCPIHDLAYCMGKFRDYFLYGWIVRRIASPEVNVRLQCRKPSREGRCAVLYRSENTDFAGREDGRDGDGRHKRREIAEVAREYLRKTPPLCQWRFDLGSVYYDRRCSRPRIVVFRNASLAA
jgi:hypothetical protein